MPADDDWAMRIIAHRAPEIVDFVIPVSFISHIVEVVDALADRVAELGRRQATTLTADGPAELAAVPPKRPPEWPPGSPSPS